MPGLLVKHLPDHLHVLLKRRSAVNRRSMSSEVICILEGVLLDRAGPPTLAEIDRLRIEGARPLDQKAVDQGIAEGRP